MTEVLALRRVGFTAADLETTAAFYGALGFTAVSTGKVGAHDLSVLGLSDVQADRLVMRLGAQEVEFLAFDPPGRPYPPGSTSSDLWFQHIAIAVADMGQAYALLMEMPGVVPITRGGPQRLPRNTGGVTAYKFRDADGHPLELLKFPAGIGDPAWQRNGDVSPFLGIDHTAMAVGDLECSRAYYRDLGFAPSAASVNRGPEQQRLDAVAGDVVDVLALEPGHSTPHLELLAYRTGPRRPIPAEQRADDIAATRLILRREGSDAWRLLRDPDGHLILDEGRASAGRMTPSVPANL